MKKIVIIISIIIAVLALLVTGIYFGINYYEEQKIKNATIIVELVDNLEVEFDASAKVSDFITNINGTIIDDYDIDTLKIGPKEIKFEYINDEDIKIPYSFTINVVDKTPPLVWLKGAYTISVGFSGNLLDRIICTDNYDDEPICQIEGEYDANTAGKYNMKFIATDSSANTTEIDFILNVTKPSSSSSSSSNTKTQFADVYANYKNENTAIGIDVSKWQGDIDFVKVKEAGVEFVFIRVGTKDGTEGEYFLDSKFEQNIQGFTEVGIPIGIYFYTYAATEKEAISDAKWILDKIKGYDITLPIVYDFEDWNNYNDYKMSLYRLNRNAEVFIETVEAAGYEGMIYGSKNYLESFWDVEGKNIWLAHYVKQTTYEGDYTFWQMCNNGRISGIYGDVDIDIMYK